MLHLVYWIAAASLLIAQLVMARAQRGERHPWHEAVWIVAPALILVWLGVLSHRSLHTVEGGTSRVALQHVEGGER